MSTSVVAVSGKSCKPFILEVMVMIPESGFKFQVLIEKACTPEKDVLWKLVFDLYRKIDGKWEQIVHVSYKPVNDKEIQGVQSMAVDGVTSGSAEVLTKEAFPVAKKVAADGATPEQKTDLKAAMSKAAVTQVEL